MQKVTVFKEELLKRVTENRKTHIEEYEEILNGYRETVAEKLGEAWLAARDNKEINFSPLFEFSRKPESHEKDYDRVIRMLEMSIEDEITLTQTEFDQFVMDEWNWKESFLTASTIYKKFAS